MRLLGKALTFDDVLLVPAYSQVLPKDTSLATIFSRNIALNLPLVSAAMDTVTESRLAIAIAQEGGMGIVHKNLTAAEQAAEVAKVKRYESGVLLDPVIITPNHTVRQVLALSQELGISGFPVCDGGKVVGIVTNRDLRFESRYDVQVKEIMTPRERLVTVPEGTTPEQAKALLNKHKLERLLVINDAFELKGLITVKDITKQTSFPNAARDATGRLRVGAAVGVGEGTEERVEALVKAGVDAIVVDTAHGHSHGVIERVKWVKQNYPHIDVVGGNIATGAAALALVKAGADAVKVLLAGRRCPGQRVALLASLGLDHTSAFPAFVIMALLVISAVGGNLTVNSGSTLMMRLADQSSVVPAADVVTMTGGLLFTGTGSRTLAYGSKFKWPGGTAPVLTTTASATDFISGQYWSDTDTILCTSLKGFA